MMYWDGGGWWLGLVWMLAIGAIIWLIVWGVSRTTRRGDDTGGPSHRQTPLDIAKERYAKGEITREQYDQLRKDLS